MKEAEAWKPTKFETRAGRLRGTHDVRELGVGSRLIGDLVAALYDQHLPRHARGQLLDLGCGKAPLYGCYAPLVEDVICVDWADSGCVDVVCDLSLPLPLSDARFDTIVFSDVLEHLPDSMSIWRELARVLAPGGRILLAVGLQAVALAFVRTRLGAGLADRSAWHFPLGYFMAVERPAPANL